MYYLEEKQFKVSNILIGIIFVPSIISLIIANIILFFNYVLLVILLIIVFIYLSLILVFWKISRNKKHYLLMQDNSFKIAYHDQVYGEQLIEIAFNKISYIDYYRINSLKGWSLLFSYVLPNSVFITYNNNENDKTIFIGYMDLKDLKDITNKHDIKLIIH